MPIIRASREAARHAVAGATRALAVAFAARERRHGGRRDTCSWLVRCGLRRRDHRADVCDRRARNRPDAETRALLRCWWVRILHRFRQGRHMCWRCWAGLLIAVAIISPALRGIQALAAAWPRNTAAVHFLGGRRVQSGHRPVLKYGHRPRPAVRRWRGQRLPLLALRRHRRLFKPSFGPCHHRLCAGLRGVGRLAPGARLSMAVYAVRHRGDPPGAAGPSSERCGGRRASSWIVGAMVRAVLVCGPAPRWLRSPPEAASCPVVGPVRGASKGLPARALRPIKADAAMTARYARFRSTPRANPTSADLAPFRHRCDRVSIVVPVRNEAENVAPLVAEIVSGARRPLGSTKSVYVNATARRMRPPRRLAPI